ncbi:MAG: hypothetical protein AW09_000591 [Candidatus Accumulibacter phosphatis]|uniref:Uncharacterized protein n=1 Tax=Candidatus Accumulibacter phosphatis TaxID=327160 RepID=A0A080MAK9_9PROT|nr:MAG: hypothetical protein AW09_000591 [Candidatus Accumulibacter phosphatis]
MFGGEPAGPDDQARLRAELLENERQLAAQGGNESVLEAELECQKTVLDNPQRYLRVAPRHLRLSRRNVVLDDASADPAADVNFCCAELRGTPPVERAFVLVRVARSERHAPQTINFDDSSCRSRSRRLT